MLQNRGRSTVKTTVVGSIIVAGFWLFMSLSGCSHKSATTSIGEGDTARQNGQFAEAERAYEEAISEAPSDPHPHVALGQLYLAEKKNELARSEFMKALEIDPANAAAHSGLGDVYADAMMPGSAEEQYRAAVALEPSNPSYRMQLGVALAKADKAGAAEAELRTAVGLNPKDAHAHLALANLLASDPKRQDEAQAEMAEVRALDPSLVPAPVASPSASPTASAAATPAAPAKLRVLDRKFLLTHDSPVYQAPNTTSAVVAQVHRRKFVHVTGMVGDWFRIQLRNGTVGYIPITTAE